MVDRALTSSMFRKESYLKEWVNVVERCKQTKSSVVVWWIEGNVAGSFVTAIKLTRRRLTPQRYAAFSPGEKPPGFRNCHRNYSPSYSLLRNRLRQGRFGIHPAPLHHSWSRIEACYLGESIDYPQLSWPDWVFGSPTTQSIEMPSQDLFGMDTLLLPSSWQRRNAP